MRSLHMNWPVRCGICALILTTDLEVSDARGKDDVFVVYRVAKSHRIPYLYMSFSAKGPGRAATERFSAQLPRAHWIGPE